MILDDKNWFYERITFTIDNLQVNFEKRCWIMSENVTMALNNNPEAAKGPMAETAFVTCLSMQPLPRVPLPRSMPFPRFYAQRK